MSFFGENEQQIEIKSVIHPEIKACLALDPFIFLVPSVKREVKVFPSHKTLTLKTKFVNIHLCMHMVQIKQ